MAHLDKDQVLEAMSGRWLEFYGQYTHLDRDCSKWRGPCPLHNGDDPNFDVNPDTGEWFCFSGCKEGGDGLTFLQKKDGLRFADALTRLAGFARLSPSPPSEPRHEPKPHREKKPRGPLTATYDYTDEQGELLYQVARYEPGAGDRTKDFLQRHPDGSGGWIWNMREVRRVLYRLPEVVNAVQQGTPVYLCEGEKDADNLHAIGLTATCNPMGAASDSGRGRESDKWLPSYTDTLCGATVVIFPDNDGDGAVHAGRVASELHGRAKRVRVVTLPNLPDKGDVSDWLAAGGTRDELLRLVRQAQDWVPPEVAVEMPAIAPDLPYRETPLGIVHRRQTREGESNNPLTNFTARIIADVVEDDGAEKQRKFEIEARLGGRIARFVLPVSSFSAMNWTVEHLGARALLYPGQMTKDHARAAIQMLSGEVPETIRYAHTGWREIEDGEWAYLHAGGAIGTERRVQVVLPPSLSRYHLPDPPRGKALHDAIRAGLRVWDILPDPLSVPLCAAMYRATLGTADFSVFLTGPTGAFKSELAALALQHFGAGLDKPHLPAGWAATDNALEAMAFVAKDAPLVIDDFVPVGTSVDVAQLHRKADRVLRGQGNNTGRQRMRADGSLVPPRSARGLILSTGEDVPSGASLKGRMCILDIPKGEITSESLSRHQDEAAAGLYAQAMAGFVAWLAPRYAETSRQMKEQARRLRAEASIDGLHARTPDITANLAVGVLYFLDYALDVGAIAAGERGRLWSRAWTALMRAAAAQGGHQTASDPALRYVELLSAAIASGKAHIAGMDGSVPDDPERWGWRRDTSTGEFDVCWRPIGDRVGWADGEDLYLQPDAAFNVVRRLGNDSGDGITLLSKTLHKRLHEHGLLASVEEKKGTLVVRRMIAGTRQTVLHMLTESLLSIKPAQSAQSAQSDQSVLQNAPSSSEAEGVAQTAEVDSTAPGKETAQRNRPIPNSPPQGSSGHSQGKGTIQGRDVTIGQKPENADLIKFRSALYNPGRDGTFGFEGRRYNAGEVRTATRDQDAALLVLIDKQRREKVGR